jgi:hypothetical protein
LEDAVFTYEIEPEAPKVPATVAAFDVNENTVVVARADLRPTADKIAQWNRRWIQSPISIYIFRTDFSRLARRYDAVRRRWA